MVQLQRPQMVDESSALGNEQSMLGPTNSRRIKLNPIEGKPLMPTISEVIEAFQKAYGFDPSGIFCSATGKRVGSTHIEELESLINLVGGDSAEEIADDIAMRLLASMRPSMKWNKFRAESLKELRKSDPIETLAYLVNRMFAPHNRLKVGISIMMNYWEQRIATFKTLNEWGINDSTNTLSYMLLELDAKWNLDTEQPPFSWQAFFIDAPDMDSRIAMVQSWYADRMVAWEKRLKDEETMTRWFRNGSALAKPAFMDAYMESKPLSPTALKKAEKSAEQELFGNLLYEIMGKPTLDGKETEPHTATPRPTFVPIRKMPKRFGVKSNG